MVSRGSGGTVDGLPSRGGSAAISLAGSRPGSRGSRPGSRASRPASRVTGVGGLPRRGSRPGSTSVLRGARLVSAHSGSCGVRGEAASADALVELDADCAEWLEMATAQHVALPWEYRGVDWCGCATPVRAKRLRAMRQLYVPGTHQRADERRQLHRLLRQHQRPCDDSEAELCVQLLAAMLADEGGRHRPPDRPAELRAGLRAMHGEGHFRTVLERAAADWSELDESPTLDPLRRWVVALAAEGISPSKRRLAEWLVTAGPTAGAIFNRDGQLELHNGDDPRPVVFEALKLEPARWDGGLAEREPLAALFAYLEAHDVSPREFFRTLDPGGSGVAPSDAAAAAMLELQLPLQPSALDDLLAALERGKENGVRESGEGQQGILYAGLLRWWLAAGPRLMAIDDGADGPPSELPSRRVSAALRKARRTSRVVKMATAVAGVRRNSAIDAWCTHPLDTLMEFMRGEGYRLIDLFNSIDQDHSGSIEKGEFVEALIRLDVPIPPQGMDALMDELDVDGDGEIDFLELKLGKREQMRRESLRPEGWQPPRPPRIQRRRRADPNSLRHRVPGTGRIVDVDDLTDLLTYWHYTLRSDPL